MLNKTEASNELQKYYASMNNHDIAGMMQALKMPNDLIASVSLEEFMQIVQVRLYDLKVMAGQE